MSRLTVALVVAWAMLVFGVLSCREEEPIVYDGTCTIALDCADDTYDCIDGLCIKKSSSDRDAVSGGADADQSLPDLAVAEKDTTSADDGEAVGVEETEMNDDDEEGVETESDEADEGPDEDMPEIDDSLADEQPDETDTTITDDAVVTDADSTGLSCSTHAQCNQYTEVCYQQKCQSPYRLPYTVKVHEVCLGPKDPNGEDWETIPWFDKPDPYAIFNLNGVEIFKTEKGDETFCKTFSASTQISFEETDSVSVVVMEYDSGGLSGDRYAGTLNLPNITVKMFRDGEYAESHPGAPLEYIKLTFVPAQ